MSIFAQFTTSSDAEVNGIRVECAANADGTIPTFIIARMGGANKRYAAELTRASKPHMHAIRSNMLSEDVAKRISLEVFCKTVLLGWENIKEENGSTIEFTHGNAAALMERLPNLHEMLVSVAQDAAAFKRSEIDAIAKN